MSLTAASVVEQPALPNLLPAMFVLGLLGLSFLPRIAGIPVLEASFQAAAAVLGVWYVALLVRSRLRRRWLAVELRIVRTHYVQALLQSSIYLYWATAWPFIAGQFPLIVGQWFFAYACSMLIGWTRRERAEIGFGPLPIVLSTNFFMCFRDEWFYLQFAMIALGILGKELLRWQRDGRDTHIFNPSAFGLFCFSIVIVLTGMTDITWAQQNAIELGRPEYMYLWIFAVGLIVQYLFEVTLVTFAAAAMLFALNLIYTSITGVYWFLDAGIPIAVFLGLHLFVTDPATSPRSPFGRAIFGALYGAGVFGLYALLEWAGAPRFYDKLLFIPVLNLMVPLIDRYARGTRLELGGPFAWIGSLAPRRQNLFFMVLWIATFAAMYATHVVGPSHPGKELSFWKSACGLGRHNACRNLASIYSDDCLAGQVTACYDFAAAPATPGSPAANPQLRTLALLHACDLGDQSGCQQFSQQLKLDGGRQLHARCEAGDAPSCYAIGTAHLMALGIDADREAAVRDYARACELRLPNACGNLAEMYRFGIGTGQDWQKAIAAYDRACSFAQAPACGRLAELYSQGDHVQRDPDRAAALVERLCRLGSGANCGSASP